MGAPITQFEIIESIRFFGQLVSTHGISESVKDRTNDYIEKLLKALESSIQEVTASGAGIQLLK